MIEVLISPTSFEEAESIIGSGADIIDVKNVWEGSLGAQFPWETKKVVDMLRPYGTQVSATLGDLPYKPGTAALAAYGAATVGATYIKAGLHGMNTYEEARDMMNAVRRAVRMVGDDTLVVAAGYADYRRFDGVSTLDVVAAARDAKCDLVMVDTAIKDGKDLFDALTYAELEVFVNTAHEAGMKVALAGSIGIQHAPILFDLMPDVIGVRAAVCEGPDRGTRISPQKTTEFVQFIHEGSSPNNVTAAGFA